MKHSSLRQVIPPPIYPLISCVEGAERTTFNYVTNFDEQLQGIWDQRRELVLKENNKDNSLGMTKPSSLGTGII